MPISFEQYNESVLAWGARGRQQLIASGRGLGISHVSRSPSRGESLGKIKDRYGYDGTGSVNRVSFGNINRSLIYTTVGAGKGRGGRKGSRWIDKYGDRKTTNPASLGKMGQDGRNAKPFIDNMLDGTEGLENLADIVAAGQADAIVNSVYVK